MPRGGTNRGGHPATWNPADGVGREIRKLRVAAYCRVSTELEQQQSSYDIQIEYYTRHHAESQLDIRRCLRG